MNSTSNILFWPFIAVWKLMALIFILTSRLIGVVIGLVFMIVGGILTVTVILVPVGVPLAAFGVILVTRGLF